MTGSSIYTTPASTRPGRSEAIRWAIGQGLERVNLSTGSDVAKTRWRPEAIDTRSGFQVHAGLRSRLSFRAAATLRRKPLPLQDAA